MRTHKVLLIPGDGIGPELAPLARDLLQVLEDRGIARFEVREAPAGDRTLEETGEALPRETLDLAKNWADAVLKGPVGESARDVVIPLRRELDLHTNLRPAFTLPGVPAVREMDLVIVRENLEDVYVGAEYSHGDLAFALKLVTAGQTRRVARLAARIAKGRSGRATIVTKSNVLRVTDGLFRRVSEEVLSREGVEHEHMYVDAAAMEMVRNPRRFDVVLTMNLYGDILSDLAAQVSGSLGTAASANVGDVKAMFEPVHGAAFDIAGRGVANPISTIMSVGLMVDWLGYGGAYRAIRKAVEASLSEGARTPDLGGGYSTVEFYRVFKRHLEALLS